ncbi:MAG: hypothetical protein AB1716_09375 [Planctomycetota bacterium]
MLSHRLSALAQAPVLTGLVVLLGLVQPLVDAGQDVGMVFTAPTNPAPTEVEVKVEIQNPDGSWGSVIVPPITIPPGITAEQKRDLIKAQLQQNFGQQNVTNMGPAGLNLHLNVDAPVKVTFLPGKTGENPDKVVVPAPPRRGAAQFAGYFDPFDYQRQPAVFTAGIVTDVGELTVQISAQELNFQTEGPIICQALFQRLAPRAPQYGAQINYAGDRLEIYFDPAYTVTQGGVVFGTTSPGEGAGGELQLPRRIVPGDMNCDGVVNFEDINPFVLALQDPAGYAQQFPGCDIRNGDINGDSRVDFSDINPFVELLTH